MSSTLQPGKLTELKPRITVIGVGGAGGNAINNMIASGIDGVEFIAANTDAQALLSSSAEHRIQLGVTLTEGLGAGAKPNIGEAAALEAEAEIRAAIEGSHMVFIAAGMGGGTGTGAASVIARLSREYGILTVAIVTKPFNFEGNRRMRTAEAGIEQLRPQVDTLIVIPNQNLFRIANERTTFAEAFLLADQVLHSGIACITDLIVREGLINLDFADVRTVMGGMGTAMMGTGEAAGDRRAVEAAELAILNPLLDEVSLRGAKGLLVSISGNRSLTLYEVDEAASRVRQEVDPDADIIIGATFDETLGEKIRVSIVASGLVGTAANYRPAAAKRPAQVRSEPVQQFARAEPYSEPNTHGAQPPQPTLSARQPEPEADPSLDRAYSDAQTGRDDSGQYPGQPSSSQWESDNDVVIELGPPELGQPEPQWQDEQLAGDAVFEPPPMFRPQPPQGERRSGRRLPDVGDFPEFAQQAYRARRPDGAPEGTPPAAPAPEKRRGGLLTFLTGRKAAAPGAGESVQGDPAAVSGRHDDPQLQIATGTPQLHDDVATPTVAQQRRAPMPRHRPS